MSAAFSYFESQVSGAALCEIIRILAYTGRNEPPRLSYFFHFFLAQPVRRGF
jgi:hypothetical protein